MKNEKIYELAAASAALVGGIGETVVDENQDWFSCGPFLAEMNLPSVKHIVVSGDIHGDFRELVYKVCVCECMHDTLVIVAGDCGFGFEKPGYYENIYKRCKKRLEEYNNLIVFVRGNHDNPAYFDGRQVSHWRWLAVPDYTVIRACGHTILCVGGAVTMERTWRERSECHHFNPEDVFQPDLYWANEGPVYNQEKLDYICQRRYMIDTVVSHTAPSFCEPKEKRTLWQWSAEDITLHRDVKKERKVMDRIYTFLKEHSHPLLYWYYGHFHYSFRRDIDGINYKMLNIMELDTIPLAKITIEQIELLKHTALPIDQNAWDFVLSKPEETQQWIAAGVLSCINRGYSLDRLTINWEAREQRYVGDADTPKKIIVNNTSKLKWPFDDDLQDIDAYLMGIPIETTDNLRRAIYEESERLIAVAKERKQFLSPDTWNTFGKRTNKQSGESIVFYDEKNRRVIKFKDPFAYMPLKNSNPYTVLYEHHIHNRLFGDVSYTFLGISQDPISGSVRLVYEQPFIDTLDRPSKLEIHAWFEERGFHITEDGYFYTDDTVSFTDVWADNCLKDGEGKLRFIDPIIRLEKEPKAIFINTII